jgi:hypothetical protein
VPPKHQWASTKLHGITAKKMALFMVTTAKTTKSNMSFICTFYVKIGSSMSLAVGIMARFVL